MKIFLKIAAFSLLTFYIYKKIVISNLLSSLQNYTIVNIFPLILLLIVLLIFYSIRLNYLIGKKCSFKKAFESVVFFHVGDLFIPGRLSELVKPAYLKFQYNVKFNSALSAVFLERLFDLLILLILTCISFLFYKKLTTNYLIISFIIILSILSSVLLLKNKNSLNFFISLIPLKFRKKFIYPFVYELRKNLSINKFLTIFGISILIYSIHVSSSIFFFLFIANLKLTFTQLFVIYIIGAITINIPIAPSGVGTFHAGLIFAFSLFGMDSSSAFMAASIIHLISTLTPFAVGIIILTLKKDFSLKFFVKNLKKRQFLNDTN